MCRGYVFPNKRDELLGSFNPECSSKEIERVAKLALICFFHTVVQKANCKITFSNFVSRVNFDQVSHPCNELLPISVAFKILCQDVVKESQIIRPKVYSASELF